MRNISYYKSFSLFISLLLANVLLANIALAKISNENPWKSHHGSLGSRPFSFLYPSDYVMDKEKHDIGPIHFLARKSTNIVTIYKQPDDSNSLITAIISIEKAKGLKGIACRANSFPSLLSHKKPKGEKFVDYSNDTTYSVSELEIATDDGNISFERIMAVYGSKPCFAFRYFFRYFSTDGSEGIKQVSKKELLETFDHIRGTFLLN